MPKANTCIDCRFYTPNAFRRMPYGDQLALGHLPGPDWGECNWRPPSLLGPGEYRWPIVHELEYCSAYIEEGTGEVLDDTRPPRDPVPVGPIPGGR